jgi:hypothetical protein
MYYSLYHWHKGYDKSFQDEMAKLFPEYFVPGEHECFLKVPDTSTAYIFQTLAMKYDVMIVDRHGKAYMHLDDQYGNFRQK